MCILLTEGGCSGVLLVRKTDIIHEMNTSNIKQDDLDFAIAMEKSVASENIFNSAEYVDVNGYRIIFNKKTDSILIARNKIPIVTIDNGQYIKAHRADIPLPLSVFPKVFVGKNYIQYSSINGIVYEDYGLDGVDVIYDSHDSRKAESYIPNKTCHTILAGLACCKDENGKFMQAYQFASTTGWQPYTTERSEKICKTINPTQYDNSSVMQ